VDWIISELDLVVVVVVVVVVVNDLDCSHLDEETGESS
jgi:hypothetical protein